MTQTQQVTSSPPSSTSVHVPDAGPEEGGFSSLGFMWHRNSARFLKDKGDRPNHINVESPHACTLDLLLNPAEESASHPIFKWFKLAHKK